MCLYAASVSAALSHALGRFIRVAAPCAPVSLSLSAVPFFNPLNIIHTAMKTVRPSNAAHPTVLHVFLSLLPVSFKCAPRPRQTINGALFCFRAAVSTRPR